MKRNLLTVALIGAIPLPFPAHAETSCLDEVVVTASRMPLSLDQTVAHTTVLNEQEIRKSSAPDVPTILRNVAGVELSQNGGPGKPSFMYLRGTDSTHVLVLLDGVRINSATTGTTALDQLMLDQVERIEVVRGNVSSLYGSEAIGGVVQIFTRHGHGAPAANVSVGMGSQGTQRLSAGFGGVVDTTDFSVQLSTFKTDGVSTLNPALIPNANPDRDGYRNNSLSASAGHAFNADHRISATLFGSDGDNQYDNAFNLNQTDVNSNRAQVWKYSLASDDQISETWHSKLQLASGVDQYRDFLNGQPVPWGSLFQTNDRQISWQNMLDLDDSKQLLLGAESLQQQVSSDINPGYVQRSRKVNSLFAGYSGRYDAHQLQVNLRQDRNSQYGNANTWLLGYGYALSDAWRATASYSTAFKAPTFNELYYPGYGNPALKPERSRNIEAGVHYHADRGQFDAVYFDNRISDLINTVLVDPINFVYQPQNVNRAHMNGFEFSYAGRFGDTGVKAELTSQNPRDATTGVQLDRRAKLHSSLGMTQQLGAWQVGGEWQYSGIRPDGSNTQTLAAYNVFNLTAGYAISKETKLTLRADNLTKQNDSNAYGYTPLGRRLFVGINYQP